MKFKKEKSEAIRNYILEQISVRNPDIPTKVSSVFSISPQTVYKYLKNLEQENVIYKKADRYALSSETYRFRIRKNPEQTLDEYSIYEKHLYPYLSGLPQNVLSIWAYCASEMINNVGDHSKASTINLYLNRDYMNTSIMIIDNGIGIFKKIKEHFHFEDLDEAIDELFKGKLTTDSTNHSGEGIFFTSRILDNFAAISDNKYFSHNKFEEIRADLADLPQLNQPPRFKTGTTIYMKLSNFSHKVLKDVFDEYADVDGGFTKTRIPLKNIYETYPVSRSQAKRLSRRLENFKEVELDFTDIDDIGQGFAHELFVVFLTAHPGVTIIPINANPTVQKMIVHVTSPVSN